MKITFIINSLKDKSGTERVACILANLFVEKLGYQVSIINRNTSYKNVAYSLSERVEVIPLQGNFFQFYIKIQQHLDLRHPDYVIVHNMGKLSLLCSLLSKGKSQMISIEHVAFPSRPWYIRLLSKLLYIKYNKIITLTHSDLFFYKKEKVCVIYNISPFERIKETGYNVNSKTIIAVGRLTYQKNFESLIDAWKRVEKELPTWQLEIYGKGEDFDMLNERIKKQKVERLFIRGESSDIVQVYRKASFFVMSSRFEGLPMVLIEAQNYGLPIVSFDCPYGPSEVIKHKENGLLVENQNINELAEAIKLLANLPETRQFYSQKAKEHSQKFSSEDILKKWKEILNN